MQSAKSEKSLKPHGTPKSIENDSLLKHMGVSENVV